MITDFPRVSHYTQTIERSTGVTIQQDKDIRTIPQMLSYTELVSSVNTGRFTPGVYRVNPYTHHGGSFGLVSSSIEREFLDTCYPKPCLVRNAYRTTGFLDADAIYWAYDTLKKSPTTSAYEQLALQKAKSKVGAGELELGEDLGEYRETIKMLRNPLGQLKKFLVDDRSRNLRLLLALAKKDRREVALLLGRTGKASVETMTGTWLELRYGLRPLVGLVQDVVKMVNDKQMNVLDPDRVRNCRSTLTFTETKSDIYERRIDLYYVYARSKVVVEDVITASASIQYKIAEQSSLADTLGLTPRFLPETAWQLTRLSFVVDWIFTIGPWLASLRINPGIEILGNTVGVKVARNITAQIYQARHVNVQSWTSANTPESTYETRKYDRKCHVDISYLPHFTWGRTLDLYKLVDALSLIWQILPNKWRK